MKKHEIVIIGGMVIALFCILCSFPILIISDISTNSLSPPATITWTFIVYKSETPSPISTLSQAENNQTSKTNTPTTNITTADPRTQTVQALLTNAAFAQTSAAQERLTQFPTNTSLPIIPTNTQSPPTTTHNVCECYANLYNCSYDYFLTKGDAQDCYDYCISIGAGDIHDLDRDHDGEACDAGLD